jgi:hypothetical protein
MRPELRQMLDKAESKLKTAEQGIKNAERILHAINRYIEKEA